MIPQSRDMKPCKKVRIILSASHLIPLRLKEPLGFVHKEKHLICWNRGILFSPCRAISPTYDCFLMYEMQYIYSFQ